MRTNPAMPMNRLFAGHMDGAKWGPSDFYPDCRAILGLALATGRDFDTGNYGVKKEIQSAQVSREGPVITCRVWVSDDFDTEGSWVVLLRVFPTDSADTLLAHIESALNHACDKATEAQRNNRTYRAFSVGRTDAGGRRVNWLWTLVLPAPADPFFGIEVDPNIDPGPSDYYDWGWNDGSYGDRLPPHVAEKFKAWAEENLDAGPDQGMVLGGWVIEPWG